MPDTSSTHNLTAKATLQDELSAALEHIRSGLTQLKAAGDDAGKGLQTASTEATGLQAKLTGLADQAKATGAELAGGLLGPLGLAAIGATTLGTALTEAIKGAEAEQASIAQLTTALKNNVPGWQAQTQAINDRIEAAKKLGIDDDATRQSLAQLITSTKDVNTALNVNALAMDLARGKGMDLQSATLILQRVQEGHLQLLQRYGIAVEKGATATQALAEIQQRYGGQASAYAQTLGGAMDRAKIAIDDAAKAAGEKLAPYIIAAAQALADFLPKVVDAADKLLTILKPALDAIGLIFGTIGFVADQAGQALGLWSDNSTAAADTANKNVSGSLSNMSDNFSSFTTAATQSGTDAGSGFSDNLSSGISDGQPSIDSAVGDVGTSLDISNNAGDTGARVGTTYVQGTPGGIVPAINAALPTVAAANQAIGETLNKPAAFATIGQNNGQAYGNAMKAAVAAFGGPVQQTFGGAPTQVFGAPAASPVNTGALFTPAPAAPTLAAQGPPGQYSGYANQMPLGHQDTAFPSAEDIANQKKEIDNLVQKGVLTQDAAKFDKALLDQEAALTTQVGKNIDFNRQQDAELKKMNEEKAKAAKTAGDHAAQLAKEAAAAAARAQAATNELDKQGNLRKAADDLTAAQKLLTDVQAHWKTVLEDDAKALQDVQDREKAFTAEVQKAIDATKAQEQALTDGFDEAAHAIDVALRAPTAALRDMQRAARDAQDAFDAQAHALSDAMYALTNEEKAAMAPLNAAVEAAQAGLTREQDALQHITDTYQNRLLPLRHELAAIDEAQSRSDHADQLHKEQLNIDNLAASLATATGAQRQQLQAQLDAARAQQGRDSRKFQLQDQIALLEEEQKKEEEAAQKRVKAAQESLKAAQAQQAAEQKLFDARKQQIQDEQTLLDHQRQEFDYEEKRKEEAKQKEIDALNDKKAALQQSYDDEKRILDAQLKAEQDSLTKIQAYWQGQVDAIQKKTDADKKMADGATAAAQKVVDAAKSQQTALTDAYTVMDQINSAHEKGAKLTQEQATALADAKKTIDQIVPSLGNLKGAYTDVVQNGIQAASAAAVKAGDTADPNSFAGAQKVALDKIQKQYQNSFGLTPDDPLANNPDVFNAGLDRMFKHTREAWAPMLEQEFSTFFTNVSNQFSTNLSAWLNQWQSTMAQMHPPGSGGGGVGATAYGPSGAYGGFGTNAVQWTGDFHVHAQKLPSSQAEWDAAVIPMSRALQKRLVQLGRA